MFDGVHLGAGRGPDVAQVGLEQGGPGLAQAGQRGPGHRQRLGDRPGGRARIEAGEQLLAGEVPADPLAGAHQDKLAEPPGARPRPRARGAAPGDDGERPEQPDPYSHVPIVPHRWPWPLSRVAAGGNTAGTRAPYRSGRTSGKGPPRRTRGIRSTRPSGPGLLASSTRSTWATPGWPGGGRERFGRLAGPAGAFPAPDLAAGAGTPGRVAARQPLTGEGREGRGIVRDRVDGTLVRF